MCDPGLDPGSRGKIGNWIMWITGEIYRFRKFNYIDPGNLNVYYLIALYQC